MKKTNFELLLKTLAVDVDIDRETFENTGGEELLGKLTMDINVQMDFVPSGYMPRIDKYDLQAQISEYLYSKFKSYTIPIDEHFCKCTEDPMWLVGGKCVTCQKPKR